MKNGNKSSLSFYRSGELHRGNVRSKVAMTAGRCSTTTTTTCAASVSVVELV